MTKADGATIREKIDSKLSNMKVEEYGLIPQSQTLDEILALIKTSNAGAYRQGQIDELKKLEEYPYGVQYRTVIDTRLAELKPTLLDVVNGTPMGQAVAEKAMKESIKSQNKIEGKE